MRIGELLFVKSAQSTFLKFDKTAEEIIVLSKNLPKKTLHI